MNEKVKEILSANGLDFKISKIPLTGKTEDGKEVETAYFGLLNEKSNEVINTVKEGYNISQNEDIIELVLRGIEPFGNQLRVSKAGSINGGRRVFIQLGIEGLSKVGKDSIERYVTIIDSNDGSTSLSVGIGDLTMSCQNQFFRFYKKSENKFRHTATLEQKMRSIPFLIESALDKSLKQIEIYSRLQSKSINKQLVDEMVKYLLGFDRELTSAEILAEKSTRSINTMDSLYSHLFKEIHSKGENLWGLHSGVTSFTTHEKSAPKRDNGRIESSLLGTAYDMNQKSFGFVVNKYGLLEMA